MCCEGKGLVNAQGIQDEYKELQRLMDIYYRGEHHLDIRTFAPMPQSLEERPLDMKHVDEIEASIRAKGTLDMARVRVVCFFKEDRTEDIPCTAAEFSAQFEKWTSHFATSEGPFIMIGNHTVEALKRVSKSYPKNRKYSHPLVKIDFVPNSPEGLWYVEILAATDNTVAGIRKKTEFRTILKNLHRGLMTIRSTLKHKPLPAKEYRRLERVEQAALKSSFMPRYNIKEGNFNLMKTIASYHGEAWEIVEDILNCRITVKRGEKKTPPKSISAFVRLGGMDEASTIDVLKRVRAGQIKLRQLPMVCLTIKAKFRIQEHIRKVCRWPKAQSWEAFLSQPGAVQAGLTDEFVEGWAQEMAFMKISDGFPQAFDHQVASRHMQMRQWAQKSIDERKRKVTSVCVCLRLECLCFQEAAILSSTVRVIPIGDSLKLTLANADIRTMASEMSQIKKPFGNTHLLT